MDYETIRIKSVEEKFIILDLLDFPTKLISSNGKNLKTFANSLITT